MPIRETEVAGIEGAVWRAQQLAKSGLAAASEVANALADQDGL